MKVFKFGGASVKDASGVKNLASIVQGYNEDMIIVVSAMGKVTNQLEILCRAYFQQEDTSALFSQLKQYHFHIMNELFKDQTSTHNQLDAWFSTLEKILHTPASTHYEYEYDRIICFGELFSTTIVSGYLNQIGIKNQFVDIRKVLKTDQNYRDANIDLALSAKLCKQEFTFHATRYYVTQGFIAGTQTNETTTLGREGSDYTAALLTTLLEGNDVTIWKDVPGVMNADPKEYPHAKIIKRMSYKEAIELTHFGAKVIHPKTIKPLQNKRIPLLVRSFIHPEAEGTIIEDIDEHLNLPPIFINKRDQLLLTLTPRDFSFIAEEKLGLIFNLLAQYRLKVNLMQNSAISFSFCIDRPSFVFDAFVKALQEKFEVLYNENVRLVTIRHYTEDCIQNIIGEQTILVEQRSRLTAQFVLLH